jgi:urea transport system permease protein
VRFSGYDVANFKVFIFCLAAVFSAIGGAMFTLQVGFMSPSFVGIMPSIEMVIFTAVGGRLSLVGTVYGSLLVNFGKSYISETFPELWLFLMGGLFIAVVMLFPNGLAGLSAQWREWRARRSPAPRPPCPQMTKRCRPQAREVADERKANRARSREPECVVRWLQGCQ